MQCVVLIFVVNQLSTVDKQDNFTYNHSTVSINSKNQQLSLMQSFLS